MSKLSDDLRTASLGVAGGVFTSSVFLICEQVNAYYTHLARIEEFGYQDYEAHFQAYGEGLWWIPVIFWHAVMYVVAAFIAHRYLGKRWRSPFRLWQVIGGAALLGWFLSLSTITALECLAFGNLYPLVRAENTFVSWIAVKFISVVFAGNVLYGSLIQSATESYSRGDSDPSKLDEACQELPTPPAVQLDAYRQQPVAGTSCEARHTFAHTGL